MQFILILYILVGFVFLMAVPLGELRRDDTHTVAELIAMIALFLFFWPVILVITVVKELMNLP